MGPSQFLIQEELRGLSNFDQPHAMLWNVSYRTPALAGWSRQLFGNWQLSTVVLGKSGTPFSVLSGSDAPGFGNVDGTQNDNPILLDPAILGSSIDPDTAAERLPKSAFGFMRPTDARGNLGRNTFRRDGILNVNMALSKRWALSGDQSILFRVESLNVTNHPQFAEPGNGIAFANFGQITNTLNDGRTFKFTLRYSFLNGPRQPFQRLAVEPQNDLPPRNRDRPLDQIGVCGHQAQRLPAGRGILFHLHFAVERVAAVQELLVVALADQLFERCDAETFVEIDRLQLGASFHQETPGLAATGSTGFLVEADFVHAPILPRPRRRGRAAPATPR